MGKPECPGGKPISQTSNGPKGENVKGTADLGLGKKDNKRTHAGRGKNTKKLVQKGKEVLSLMNKESKVMNQ